MVDRETCIEQSVAEYVKTELQTRGYASDYSLVDAWPQELVKLETNLVSIGFTFDSDGEQAECGSDLKRKVYNIEFYVFGLTNTFARNLANQIKFACDKDGTIPLLDVSQPTPWPEMDRLIVLGVIAHNDPIPQPQPWQEFVWRVRAQVEDTYYASLA